MIEENQKVIIKNIKKRIIKKKKIIKKEEKICEPKIKLTLEEKYLLTLTNEEKETLQIAKEHLKSSFNMEKSVGFTKYKIKNSI